MPASRAQVAYCEEEDEDGRILINTIKSASVKAAKDRTKERSKNTSRDRPPCKASKTNSDSGYSTGAVHTGSEISSSDPIQHVQPTKESKKPRRPSMGQRHTAIPIESRPPQSPKNRENKEHRRNLSVKMDSKPEHYGVQTPASSRHPQTPVIMQPSIPMRPRALTTHAQTHSGARPSTYHAGSASVSAIYPPISTSAFFQPHQSSHQVGQFQAPPPSPAFNNYAVVPAPQTTGYFQPQEPQVPSRSLLERFEPQQGKRASVYGIRDEPAQTPRMITGGYERKYHHYSEDDTNSDSYESSAEEPIRRTVTSSIRVPSGVPSRGTSSAVSESNFSKAESTHSRESIYSAVDSGYNRSKSKSRARRDSQAMPPRPELILRRPTVEMPVYDDTISQYSVEEFHDEPRAVPRRRPSAHRKSVSYDVSDLPRETERFRLETADSKNRHHKSYYGQSASSTQASTSGSSGYEAKLSEALSGAANYMEEVGGPSIPLTAEALKREQRRQAGGSSRSTKSSRRQSDYRGTQTTRTTRSSDDDNVTIEVTGQAKVTVGGAEIRCGEGGKIHIHRTEKIHDSNASQATDSEYGHAHEYRHAPKLLDDRDRRSRLDRSDSQTTRSRMRSQHSYTRVSPRPQERDRAPRERREDYEARAANWETPTTTSYY